MVYAYPQRYPELAYYRNFIMQQDKKFIWPAVQIYDIGYHAMCAHHGCPYTMTDQALMATILDATVVKVSAHKCFYCRGFSQVPLSPDCITGDGRDFEEGDAFSKADAQASPSQIQLTYPNRQVVP